MNSTTYRTATRVYHLSKNYLGLWSCFYRVINKVTGQEWQGIKHAKEVSGTHFATYTWGPKGETIPGPITEGKFSWDKAPKDTRGASIGYLTEEALLEAIKAVGK